MKLAFAQPAKAADIVKLTDDPVWQAAAAICQYCYQLAEDIDESEKWGIAYDLRHSSYNLTSNVAEACGNFDPRDRAPRCDEAVGNGYGLKNSLTMAKRLLDIKIDPQIMVDLDAVTSAAKVAADAARAGVHSFTAQYESNEHADHFDVEGEEGITV